MYSTKSVEVAGVLGIILGSIGAHDWYLGNKKGAWAHVGLLALSVVMLIVGSIVLPLVNPSDTSTPETLGTITMIILIGNAVWGMLEGILILVQGRAGLLRREEKEREAAQKKTTKGQAKNAPVAAAPVNAQAVPAGAQTAQVGVQTKAQAGVPMNPQVAAQSKVQQASAPQMNPQAVPAGAQVGAQAGVAPMGTQAGVQAGQQAGMQAGVQVGAAVNPQAGVKQ